MAASIACATVTTTVCSAFQPILPAFHNASAAAFTALNASVTILRHVAECSHASYNATPNATRPTITIPIGFAASAAASSHCTASQPAVTAPATAANALTVRTPAARPAIATAATFTAPVCSDRNPVTVPSSPPTAVNAGNNAVPSDDCSFSICA